MKGNKFAAARKCPVIVATPTTARNRWPSVVEVGDRSAPTKKGTRLIRCRVPNPKFAARQIEEESLVKYAMKPGKKHATSAVKLG